MNENWDIPDWSREEITQFWEPGKKLLKSIRDYQRYKEKGTLVSNFMQKICVLRHKFWSIVTGAEIDLNCSIGGGLLLPHPNGIVIHPKSIIGNNCLIFQQVTLAGKVTLDNHVDIGAGAKLLGPLTIGKNVKIGANSVVTKSFSANNTVVGIPAKIIKK